jgi:hypothetical protein
MLESSFVRYRMFCANLSHQKLIGLWIPSAQVACWNGLWVNASDAIAPAVPYAGVISGIFDQFLQFCVYRRLRGGMIGQGYQPCDATFLF